MSNPEVSLWTIINTVLIGMLTLFGAVLRWNWNRLVTQVDGKVDRTDVTQRHVENLAQFAEIKDMITASDKLASQERHDVRDRLGALTVTVAILADRADLKQ